MEFRLLAPLKIRVSAVGFGTWPLTGVCEIDGKPVGRGDVDETAARTALHAALDAGINFFDTAPTYGQTERWLGKVLSRHSEPTIICTKFGIRVTSDGRAIKDFSERCLRASVENSLRALGRERLDVLLLHSPHDEFDWLDYDERPLEQLVQAGKIGCYGVSCHSIEGARRVLQFGFGQVLEVIYNALDRRAEEEVLPEAAKRQIGVIARVPLAQGFLAGRYLDARPLFSTTDHRSTFSREEMDWLCDAARKLQFLDRLPGGTATAALRFCLSHSAVSSVIPGMRSREQVCANAAAADLGSLDKFTLDKIHRAVPEVFPGWQRKVPA